MECLMALVHEVPVCHLSFARYHSIVGAPIYSKFVAEAKKTASRLAGTTIWHINSSETGSGSGEILPALLGYHGWLGLNGRWLVISGDNTFLTISKRIYNAIHGFKGDGGPLGPMETKPYEKTLEENLHELLRVVRSGDIVVLHDPPTVGLSETFKRLGAKVIWRCHLGQATINKHVKIAWNFLSPYLKSVDEFVFTLKEYVPTSINPAKVNIVSPSIDAFSPKNQPLDSDVVTATLVHSGLIAGDTDTRIPLKYSRRDGSPGIIKRGADIMHCGPLPTVREPMVLQISRWDRMKDMLGVMAGFASHVSESFDPHLVLAGPDLQSISEDPQSLETYKECIRAWHRLPYLKRRRIQIACIPMEDPEENGVITNALQRHATVVVQKSLYEAFGLTVTEAMWKGRPVVGSAVGGIKDQIIHGKTGFLISDPSDLKQMGDYINELLGDTTLRKELGEAAQKRVIDQYLVLRHLSQYLALYEKVHPSSGRGNYG